MVQTATGKEEDSVGKIAGGGAKHHGEEEEPGVRRKKEQGQGPPRPGWLKLELDRACDWAPWRQGNREPREGAPSTGGRGRRATSGGEPTPEGSWAAMGGEEARCAPACCA